MAIDGEKFLEWAESRFGHCLLKGNEVRINSPFFNDDTGHHCWCRVDGSTKKGEEREFGIYHCFKTDKRGSLPGLVMMVDGVEFREALEILGADDGLRDIDLKLQAFFDSIYGDPKPVAETPKSEEPQKMAMPPSVWRITELASNNRFRVAAEIYLKSRKLPPEKYFIGTAGPFRNRIVIPYYDWDGKLIYFNGRLLGDAKAARYRGPDYETYQVGKDDVLYMPEWPPPGAKVYLNEGEFDADSIYYSAQSLGEKMYAAAFGGKNVSEKQVEILRPFVPVLGLDADWYGKRALARVCQDMKSKHIMPYFVRPPDKWKDWNKMLQETSPKVLVRYIQNNERPITESDLLRLLS